MSDRSPALVGRHLLDRRGFLGHMASGMGGIALSALLAEQGLLAADGDAKEPKPAAPPSTRWPRSRRTSPAGRSGCCTSSAPARSATSTPGITSPS